MKPVRLSLAQTLCRNLPPLIAQRVRSWVYPFKKAYRDDYEFLVRAQTGSRFRNRTSDMAACPFSVHGYSYWRNWAIALAVCSLGDTIVEVGAHVGTETIGFADIVGEQGKVYAFEPLPSNLMALKDVCELNDHKGLTVLPFAVAEECKKMRFVLPAEKCSSIAHLLGPEEVGVNTIEVDCVTLDSFSDYIGPIKSIFIDAEGAEVMILRGARNTIAKYRPAIVLEAAPGCLERSGVCLKGLHEEIISMGYKAFKISLLGLSGIELRQFKHREYHNWFCVHRTESDVVKAVNKYILRCGLLPCLPGLNPMVKWSSR